MCPAHLRQMTNPLENNFFFFKASIRQGLEKGWHSFVWLLKIILPVSCITATLVHFGIIYKLDFILTPAMTWIGLPPSAALVLVLGLFTGIYGVVGALAVMPFTMEHMILIAIFSLICHNIIQESIVQGNSGINPVFAGLFRLVMAFAVTFVCAKILGVNPHTGMMEAQAPASQMDQSVTFLEMISAWGWKTLKLVIQIFCIIMPLMIIMELAKVFHVIDWVTKMISPLLRFFGLDRSTGLLWLTACVFGLAYGSAVIVEETRSNTFSREDLKRLHLSIGVNHAMIEDPALFLPLGLPIFWLWVPRIVAALLAAWLYWAFISVRRRYA